MKLFYLERQNCEEFYEVYKGVVPEFVVNVDYKDIVLLISINLRS